MKRTNKKGFTIVELVIVIAVIAILAAVLIPTFASLVDKAHQSADTQAVRQMNTYLAANEVEGAKDIVSAYKALAEGGMTAKDYKALATGRYFYWDADENRILYVDENDTVLYPEEYKGTKFDSAKSNWFSLSGTIEEKDDVEWSDDKKTVTVKTAEQLYYVVNHYEELAKNGLTEIKLTQSINMRGAEIGFGNVTNELTITADSQVTLSHFTRMTIDRPVPQTGDSWGKKYDIGLIGASTSAVTIKNIIIDHAAIGDLEAGSVGALIGRVGGGIVKIDNCQITDTTVYGRNKVGGLVGAVAESAKVSLDNGYLENVTVNCSEGQAAIVVGCVYNNPTVTIDKEFSSDWVKNCSTNLVKGEYDRDTIDVSGKELTIDGSSATVGGITKLVAEWDKNSVTQEFEHAKQDGNLKYRMYIENAYMTVQTAAGEEKDTPNLNASNIEINGNALTGTNTDGNFDAYGSIVKVGEATYYAPVQHAIK